MGIVHHKSVVVLNAPLVSPALVQRFFLNITRSPLAKCNTLSNLSASRAFAAVLQLLIAFLDLTQPVI